MLLSRVALLAPPTPTLSILPVISVANAQRSSRIVSFAIAQSAQNAQALVFYRTMHANPALSSKRVVLNATRMELTSSATPASTDITNQINTFA